MNKIYLLIGCFLFAACASSPNRNENFNLSQDRYEDLVAFFSDHNQQYDGPYNILDVTGTILNSHVIEAQTLRQATVFQWEPSKFQTELRQRLSGARGKTEVFVSFFTPDRKSSDLTRGETLWKTILKFDGKEIAGKPKKITLLPVEIMSLYPQHSRWSNAYIITFETPTTDLERGPTELVITGPAGTTNLKFRPIKGPLYKQ